MSTLLLTVDSLRYDYVFGEHRDFDLPTIDRLADEGVVFDTAVTNAPYTTDSFTSILGGTHPWAFGTEPMGFEEDRPHVVEPFEDASYETIGVFGNPYLGPSFGFDRGFDHYVNGDDSKNPLGILRDFVVNNLSRDSPLFRFIRYCQRTVSTTLGSELEGQPYANAEKVNESFTQLLTDTTGPVFGWLHYMDVHSPFYPHEGTRSDSIDESEAVQTFYEANMRPTDVSKSEKELLRDLYVGEIQYLDRCLGDLLETVDELLGLGDTTIVLTSDHGEAFGEHGFCFHPKELYEELVRIPLVVRDPDEDTGCVSTPVSNVDIFPTLTRSADLEASVSVSGEPLQDIVEAAPEERYVYSHAIDEEIMKAMIFDGRYKLIRDIDARREELYDLQTDPDEKDDRISTADTTSTLQGRLDEHLDAMDTGSRGGEDHLERSIPDDVQQQLEDLGYQ